ncbi:endonuclease/exonuclease/phosphatase family protein [Polaribacter gangjinensis]|uniref:Endonuclease n=1 Tax=Polaribacter gangjinensis TaxID=574710 RepID=A0A2S7W919_9FLAO|nr:endonuclease/exonuclease/phosphatase family protein [Polaribacter gangjinensis]PQJ74118.1 endonuclease [Polaribacter gangjinensis]
MKKLSIINKIIYFINIVVAILLFASYLLPFISPEKLPILAIASLLVPFLIFANIVFAIYWLLSFKRQFLVSSSILILGWLTLTPIYKLFEKKTLSNNSLSVMSYNVRLFNQYEWINDTEIPTKINMLIQESSPDILVFQDYYSLVNQDFKFNFKYVNTKTASNKNGLAIYSKYPIINSGSLDLKHTSNNIIYADILRGKDTIRVYNLHLQSLKLKTDKENFGQENSEKLVSILEDGFKKQVNQTTVFLDHEKKWKGKKIIAGDFNNTSFSWVYNQISKDKKDAFIEAGKGFGKTFNYWFPLRIDFILTDNTAEIHQFSSFNQKYSDHFPIMTTINW